MPYEKVHSYRYDLVRIVKVLVNEIDKPDGPDWSKVFAQAQDLMALSQSVIANQGDKNPPS